MIEGSGRPSRSHYDVVIVGAGFYGCALAGHLADRGQSVLVCEAGPVPMARASAVNQARVHTGFHYPRSLPTAIRSRHNFERFSEEFSAAIHRDFQMLYAIARYGTKVDARRFYGMFEAMRAPIRAATSKQRSLFSRDLIEEVFACTEFAFDWMALRTVLMERISSQTVEFAFKMPVERVEERSGGLSVILEGGARVDTGRVFNIAYSQINAVLKASGLATLPLKHELVEIALVAPPSDLSGVAVTVMDGAFFSTMPYPSTGAYSLTHVRYTPHFSWTDQISALDAYRTAARLPQETRWKHMVNDARRYVPVLANTEWKRSLFEVKTVPMRNEVDDGRPILLQRHADMSGLYSVLGSKIDNIYDLYEAID